MSARLFALDTETSAVDSAAGGRIIQIGVVADTDLNGQELPGTESFTSLVNPGKMAWSVRSEGIHGFTREEIEAAPTAATVDTALCEWLEAHGATPGGGAISVGFNVASFDIPHLGVVLPRAAGYFTYKAAELNALCYALDGHTYNGRAWSDRQWKDAAVRYAETTIRSMNQDYLNDEAAHDAGYDALIHLHAYRWLRAAIHGDPWAVPTTPVPVPRSVVSANALIARMGLEDAALKIGVHPDILLGWSEGGRATNKEALTRLHTAVESLTPAN